MSWQCSSCGFDGNDDDTLRCSCGHENLAYEPPKILSQPMNTTVYYKKYSKVIALSISALLALLAFRVVYVRITYSALVNKTNMQQCALADKDATKIAFNVLQKQFGANKNYYVVSSSKLQIINGKTILNVPRMAWVIRFNKHISAQTGILPGYIELSIDANTGKVINDERSR